MKWPLSFVKSCSDVQEHQNCSRKHLASFPLFPVLLSVYWQLTTPSTPAVGALPSQLRSGSVLHSELTHRSPGDCHHYSVLGSSFSLQASSAFTLPSSFLLAFLWLNSGAFPERLKQLNKVHPLLCSGTVARRECKAQTPLQVVQLGTVTYQQRQNHTDKQVFVE